MCMQTNEGKKIAYVIGPYRDQRGVCFMDRNIQRARALARLLWQKGYTVICPHSNSAFFDDCTDDQAFLDGYLQLLAIADIAFVVPSVEGLLSYRESYGSMQEIELCQIQNIPVVYSFIDNAGVITLSQGA